MTGDQGAAGAPGGAGRSGDGGKPADLKVRVPEQLIAGVYANSMMVHHTPSEFVMDFAMIMGANGQVVARVITSPAHMKQVVEALTENLRKYESAYGPIGPRPTKE